MLEEEKSKEYLMIGMADRIGRSKRISAKFRGGLAGPRDVVECLECVSCESSCDSSCDSVSL